MSTIATIFAVLRHHSIEKRSVSLLQSYRNPHRADVIGTKLRVSPRPQKVILGSLARAAVSVRHPLLHMRAIAQIPLKDFGLVPVN
jgi:hypothetical protein